MVFSCSFQAVCVHPDKLAIVTACNKRESVNYSAFAHWCSVNIHNYEQTVL